MPDEAARVDRSGVRMRESISNAHVLSVLGAAAVGGPLTEWFSGMIWLEVAMRVFGLLGVLGLGCATPIEVGPCNEVCDVLFKQCAMESFDSFKECESSCTYGDEEGADIPGYASCLSDVDECNTYEIVECENEYGW
tara:strand:- start:303 stop:713 length:411 start_codon:yes stop_codon:yes gene_type:complete